MGWILSKLEIIWGFNRDPKWSSFRDFPCNLKRGFRVFKKYLYAKKEIFGSQSTSLFCNGLEC